MSKPAIVVALITPFDDMGEIDLAALAAHVSYLVDAGVDGIMPCGTTGEGPLLSDDEVISVIRVTVDAADRGAKTFAHVGRPGTPPTLRLAERALESGADSVVAVTPYYYELEQGALFDHYVALIQCAGGAPAYAYNIPAQARNDLDAATTAKLADHGLAGLKDSTKSLARHRDYLAVACERAHAGRLLEIFMGSDAAALDAYRLGSTGSVSALANVRPDLFVQLRDAFADHRDDDAGGLQEEISRIRAEVGRGTRLVGLKRATAELLGGIGHRYPPFTRRPLG